METTQNKPLSEDMARSLRCRGNAIERDDGRWGYEILVTLMGHGDDGPVVKSDDTWPTKEQAIAAAKEAIKLIMDSLTPDSIKAKMLLVDLKDNLAEPLVSH